MNAGGIHCRCDVHGVIRVVGILTNSPLLLPSGSGRDLLADKRNLMVA